MTTDNAIAVLRRMQEPDPFEPQITQTAFDALEMAIDMIERYSTWSQTYSNMVEDAISRKAAIDVIHKCFAERIEQSPTHMTEDGEVYDLGICNPLLADNKALSQAIKELPSAQPTEASCWGCNCPKMERLKVQKTFSEMVHLHDAEQQWIPCSERLPDEETDVLICNRNGDIALSRGSYSTGVENDFIWYTSGWRFGKVIAWMPLPEPWRGEETCTKNTK